MTLNITLAGPFGVHQSTDFRLTRIEPGRPPSLQSDASPKQVTLHYGLGPDHWDAVVGYAGIGAWRTLDTCSWLVRWVKGNDGWPTVLGFEEAIERIRSEGTKWLAQMSAESSVPLPHHSFVVGAFVGGKPQVVLISNFERIGHPPSATVSPQLVVTRRQPHKQAVLVTGMSGAVSRADRRLLRSLLRAQADPKRIRGVLADVTARASESPASCDMVSPSSMVYSLLPDGTSGGEKYGEVEGDFIPHTLFTGLDTFEMLRMVVEHMGTGQYIPSDNRHG